MKKRLITLAVAAALAAPLTAQADDVEVKGFSDIIYTVKDSAADPYPSTPGATNPSEGKFTADAEVDFIASPADGVTARIDLDLDLVTDGGANVNGSDSARIEQAFFAWNMGGGPMTLVGGVFNNPIGQDAEDAPDINFTNHSAIYNILDHQTALNGNNIAGVAVAGGTGMFTGTLAYLNDIQQVDEENSVAIVLNVAPTSNVDLEFGYVTQKNDSGDLTGTKPIGAGDVWDLNGSWNSIAGSGASVGFDYLSASSVVDNAWNIWAGFEFANNFVVRGRYESAAASLKNGGKVDDTTAYALYGAWQAMSNLLIALEYRNVSAMAPSKATSASKVFDGVTGLSDGQLFTVEFIATLP